MCAEYATTSTGAFVVGFKEDYSDVIKDISPQTTPIQNMLENEEVDSVEYETYAEDLYSRDGTYDIARDEDVDVADVTAKNEDLIKMTGYTMIYFEYVKCTETAAVNKKVGITDLLDHKGARLLIHLKQNYETRILTGVQMKKHHASSEAGYFMGAPGLIGRYADECNGGSNYGTDSDNVVTSISSFGDASPRAIGSVTPTDAQECLDIILEQRWEDGGDPDTLVVKGSDKREIAGFDSSGATRYYEDPRKVVENVEIYESPLGEVRVIPSHAYTTYADGGTEAFDTGSTQVKDFALLFNPMRWKTVTLKSQGWRSENVPKTGLLYRRYYTAEVGLRCYNCGGDAIFNFTANADFTHTVSLYTTAASYTG